MPSKGVKELYRKSLKLPHYLPLENPCKGYHAPVVASGKLKHLLLLPLSEEGRWQGKTDKGAVYEVRYDSVLGLQAGRV